MEDRVGKYMYEYVKVDNPKLTSSSLFTRKGNTVINIRKTRGIVEVSIALGDAYFPAFDIKLIGDKIWSRYGNSIEEYSYYYELLSKVRDDFPYSVEGFGDWGKTSA